jgi:nitronate monooxygenase
MAPMAGACPPGLATAVANAGGMGGFGALMSAPDAIAAWAEEFRSRSNGSFQINLWVPDPPPRRDPKAERRVRDFLSQWGPPVPAEAGDAVQFDFAAQCDALLDAGPQVVSSIMGLFAPEFVDALKTRGIAWFACATTAAEAAGADAIVAQGLEAWRPPRRVRCRCRRAPDGRGSSRSCRASPMRCRSRSSRPAASQTAAASPPP